MNDARKSPRSNVVLAVACGILLGISFPPFETGILAAVAFLPFFFLFEHIDRYGEAIRFSYLTFFIFNAVTVYWTGGFTHGKDAYLMIAGALLLLAHPFFFAVPVLVWVSIRKKFGYLVSLISFPFVWISFEYLHSKSELAFPWLTLGNTQTYDLPVIQISSITGVYGISFWLLVLNAALFFLLMKISKNEWKFRSSRSLFFAIAIILFYLAPKLYGSRILHENRFLSEQTCSVAVIQPDIDPFQKWELSSDPQLDILLHLTDSSQWHPTDLVLWPETSIPVYILHPGNRLMFDRIRTEVDSLHCNLLAGTPDIVYYPKGSIVPPGSKESGSGESFETFNSSVLLQPGQTEIQKYAKKNLVPFAERVPYSNELGFLNAMKWNFGLGGWNIGRDSGIFHIITQNGKLLRFSTMICYESIYPALVSDFVRNGAEFLTVLTNDSWWGNTSGTYQHKQIAVLRAVENRRWVVQCANGGISCFIDPYGHTVASTSMYTQAVLHGTVVPLTGMSFYTLHGDWFAVSCLMITISLLIVSLGKSIYMRLH